MLRDDRVRGLATEFAGNWLDFRRFEEHNSVDRERFPTFDDELRRAMFEEPIRFFLDVVRNDRPVLEFLDGKHTFVNPALARHYGMPEPPGGPDDWVAGGRRDEVRAGRAAADGGLPDEELAGPADQPGQARLLGRPPPPRREDPAAPGRTSPSCPSDEAKLGELTLRETLARHRADVRLRRAVTSGSTRSAWRSRGTAPWARPATRDLGGRPVDIRAAFPGGVEGAGVEGLRAVPRRRGAGRSSSRTSAGSCWRTPSGGP